MTYKINSLQPRYKESINPVAALGFIGLATDRASLQDFNDFVSPFEGVATHSTRIPFAPQATPETLAEMGQHLANGAEMLLPGQLLNSISYSCTSGTIAIGVDNVRQKIQSVRPDVPVVTPIEAAIKALNNLGCKQVSLLMPYLMTTSGMVAGFFESNGFQLDNVATFDLEGDPQMNRVDAECIYEAGLNLCHEKSDALFISCTGWRTHNIVQRLEDTLGRPVVTSNQALAWQALRCAGVTQKADGQGAVFSRL